MKPIEDDSLFDQLRRFTAGTMSPDERARFEAQLGRDPELARRAAEFQDVWRATAGGLGLPVASRTRFDDLAARLDVAENRSAWRRRAAAAVVLFAIAASAWFVWRPLRSRANDVVELRTIPLDATTPIQAENAALPAVLANWSPVEAGQVRWLDSIDEARAISAAVSRPIFVFGYVEQCPICQGFLQNEFQDPSILALIDQAVPLRINLVNLDQAELQAVFARRYPLLEMRNERGEILHTFAGTFAEVDMRGELARAVAGLAGPNWKAVHELAAAFVKASSAEADGRLGEAAGSFAELATNRELPKFAQAGTDGLSRMAAGAARLLADARSNPQAHDGAALKTFQARAEQYAGTPFEPDLRAVLRAWKDSGRFPALSQGK